MLVVFESFQLYNITNILFEIVTIKNPTLGAIELLAEGHLSWTIDAATQQAALTLLSIERIV